MREREHSFPATDAAAPRVLPFNWREVRAPDDSVRVYRGRGGLRVLLSAMLERDGKHWLHVSFSRGDRLPSWDDVRAVKDLFVGPEAEALQILPPASEYVNIHPYTLHLWHCLDGPVCPDFRTGGQI